MAIITRIGPRHWPTMKAAAADLGISVNTLARYMDAGREEELLSNPTKSRAQAITIDGVSYPSITAAESALHKNPRRLKKEAAGIPIGPTAGVPITFLGKEFKSLGSLAMALGYQRRSLYRPYKQGKLPIVLEKLETLYRAMKRIEGEMK